jgi:hypothetical protein
MNLAKENWIIDVTIGGPTEVRESKQFEDASVFAEMQ